MRSRSRCFFGNFENGTLAIGLDVGLVGGALIAPKLNWSSKRSKQIFAASTLGLLIGGATPGLFTKRNSNDPGDDDYNGDLIAGCMTASMWGGFILGIAMTGDQEPDPKFNKPKAKTAAKTKGVNAMVSPWTPKAPTGQTGMGVMTSGTW